MSGRDANASLHTRPSNRPRHLQVLDNDAKEEYALKTETVNRGNMKRMERLKVRPLPQKKALVD